jgi:hypothetical protein
MIFVLDRHHKPLMPCTEKRARLLLERGRAVVHRRTPFTIRLRDRRVEDSALQPVVLKFDPGSKTTGVAVVREEQTPVGAVHHALHLTEISHRGDAVHERMQRRAAYRRRRRTAHLRYRPPCFNNRRRSDGWLAPWLRSRVKNIVTWAQRYQRLAPLTRVDLELARFDTQQLVNSEIAGVEYQQGTLQGYEVRAYRLEKFGRRCVYCGATGVPLKVEHARDALCVGDLAGVAGATLPTLTIRATGRGRHCRTNVNAARRGACQRFVSRWDARRHWVALLHPAPASRRLRLCDGQERRGASASRLAVGVPTGRAGGFCA